MGFPYYADVERSHNELLASGQIKRRDNQEATEHDKGLLTRRAGFYANQRDPTIGILEKTSGNNALGYSVDLLITTAGIFWDVATDTSGLAMPVNGEQRGPDPELALKWRQPTAALAGLTDVPVPIPPSPSGDVIPYDEARSVRFGKTCNQVYADPNRVPAGAPPDPGMIAVHAERDAYDYYTLRLPDPECFVKHVNEFRAVYHLPPL